MITLKSPHEIELMRRAGKITAAARALGRGMGKPGVTTAQIDKAVFQFIKEQGATPSFLHYNGYPASVCVSVNDEIIHGIPGKRMLQEEEKPEPKPAPLTVDYVAECEKSLTRRLDRKVRIVNGKRKGRFELEFYGQEDLQRLYDALLALGKTEEKPECRN